MAERYPVETLDSDYEDDGTMPNNVADLADKVVGHRIVSVERDAPLPARREAQGNSDHARQRQARVPDRRRRLLRSHQPGRRRGTRATGGYTTWADMRVLELPGNPYGYGFQIFV
jgi:hypothetical protein